MVNVNKLKGKIVEKATSVEQLATLIGIDKSTLYRKLGGNGIGFTIGDADKIAEALELNSKEATEIFLAQFVA